MGFLGRVEGYGLWRLRRCLRGRRDWEPALRRGLLRSCYYRESLVPTLGSTGFLADLAPAA